MDKASRLAAIERVIAQGPFHATMKSLTAYRVPDWYQNGKFGIFIHWGPYCVPAFGSEWYPREMYQQGKPEYHYHIDTYGPHKNFGYKDFIPLFKAEQFNAADWAELFRKSGARFIVPVAEHHDGFQMYKSALCRWNAFEMGPKRDILGELGREVRARGMVLGASSHRAEHYWFMDGVREFETDIAPDNEDLYGPAEPHPKNWGSNDEAPPTAEHMDDWLMRTCELVDEYRPQLVWFDWWINNLAFRPYLEKFAAYYYNRAAEWGIGVAINYKYHAYDEGAAVFDVERGQLSGIRPMLWQNDTSISKNSWGYIDGQDYKTATDILCDLVDIVSKNGALLLNIGPKADGTIPEPEQQILLEIGEWLSRNGEAIYDAGYFRVFGEGPTEIPEGAFTDTKRLAFTGQDIRFTTRPGALYALLLGRPEGNTVTIASVTAEDGVKAARTMDGEALAFRQIQRGLEVTLSERLLAQPLPLAVKLEL